MYNVKMKITHYENNTSELYITYDEGWYKVSNIPTKDMFKIKRKINNFLKQEKHEI